MREEVKIFLTALMFYTRIPCPSWVDHSEEYINKATRYFPLIGWIVGSASALVVYLAATVFPASVCIVLSLITGVLVTGAFHEDGFGDVCDGFGGGWTKEKILAIMKDSRIGAYGVIGLFALFSLKLFVLIELFRLSIWFCLKSILLAHVLSRFMAVTIIYTHEYVREDATSKIKPIAKKLNLKNLLISGLWLLPTFLLFQHGYVFWAIIPTYAVTRYLAHYFQKWIGGYTGDCLGATQQITEAVTLLFCLGLWKFI